MIVQERLPAVAVDTAESPFRVMIIDDHPVVRDGFQMLIEMSARFRVCKFASSTEEALRLLDHCTIDLALVDINLPGQDGLAFIEQARHSHPALRCVVLTSHAEPLRVARAMAVGAHAFVSKTASRQDLMDTLLRVAGGETVLPTRHRSSGHLVTLTEAEQRVLGLLSHGDTNEQIGKTLGVSVNTVKSQVSSLLRKLDVENRTSALIKARSIGLL